MRNVNEVPTESNLPTVSSVDYKLFNKNFLINGEK